MTLLIRVHPRVHFRLIFVEYPLQRHHPSQSETRIKLKRKTSVIFNERSPETLATLKNQSHLCSEDKYVGKSAERDPLAIRNFQEQLVNSGNSIPFPKIFS